MTGDVLRLAARMEAERKPFALATVVRSERPTSGKPGNTALIDPGGAMHGWIGGSCTRSEVIRHALEALRLGEPRLLAFGADEGRTDDLVQVSMSCASGGKVEVHINPVMPAPVLLVAGNSPVALALLRLGSAMGYRTVAAAADDEEVVQAADDRAQDLSAWAGLLAARPPGTRMFAVVATMGREDERTLAHLAAAGPDYLGVVASPRRMRSVRAVLSGLGLADDAIGRIHGPAGLDLGARQPEEIAVSILAEIVAETRTAGEGEPGGVEGVGGVGAAVEAGSSGGDGDAAGADGGSHGGAAADSDGAPAGAWATDPVCGMTVPVAGSPSAVHDGRTRYFCCEGCRGLFESTPEAFAANPATGPA